MWPHVRNRLVIPAVFFGLTAVIWILTRTSPFNLISLALGLIIGSFLLDTDVLIHYLLFHPESEKASLIRHLFADKQYRQLFSFLISEHLQVDNYIFHHIQFILALTLVSLFVFTTSTSILGISLVLAIHFHLLEDISSSFRSNPAFLQSWLFSRLDHQLPLSSLKQILLFYFVLVLIFSLLLIRLGL